MTATLLTFQPSSLRPRQRLRTDDVGALAAFARKPGRQPAERNWELEAARTQIDQLTSAITAQAIELAVVRGKSGWD